MVRTGDAMPADDVTPRDTIRQDGGDAASDLDLVDAVLRGATDRYAPLVARYQRAAWKLAYGFVGNMEDARELSQNSFVKAYRALRSFRRTAKFSTWLYRIVVNECKDFHRRKGRRPLTVSLTPDPDDDDQGQFDVEAPGAGPREIAQHRELSRRLTAALPALSPQQRQAFVLHHLQGMTVDDAAEVMGCRAGTVKMHLFRACEHLRRHLGDLR